jgi:lipoate-protein ligase A
MCVGTHVPTPHRYLQTKPSSLPAYIASAQQQEQHQDHNTTNTSCCIVMGIGGKPRDLLNIDKVKQDGVWVIKRFSGGGTVVVDHHSIWTTLIGRTQLLHHVEPYPRSIMAYTATILEPMWQDLRQQQQQQQLLQATATTASSPVATSSPPMPNFKPTMVLDTKSCAVENTGLMIRIPDHKKYNATTTATLSNLTFQLRENDYVLGDHKMAGNAQSIVKEGWLHHTSFLWDYEEENMNYLTLPSRRPDYRGQRNHDDFLIKLQPVLHPLKPRDFLQSLQRACQQEFGEVQVMTLRDAMAVVYQTFGSMDACLAKSRNRVMDLAEVDQL